MLEFSCDAVNSYVFLSWEVIGYYIPSLSVRLDSLFLLNTVLIYVLVDHQLENRIGGQSLQTVSQLLRTPVPFHWPELMWWFSLAHSVSVWGEVSQKKSLWDNTSKGSDAACSLCPNFPLWRNSRPKGFVQDCYVVTHLKWNHSANIFQYTLLRI